jgi:hypothetical protein
LTVKNVSVGSVDGVDERRFLHRNGCVYFADLQVGVHSGGAIRLHQNRRHLLALKAFMSERERVGADRKVDEVVAAIATAGLSARQRGLVANQGHDGSRHNAAGVLHDRSSYSAESLLRLCQGTESKQHSRGQGNQKCKETVPISQWHG